ncbi:MAG: radical SAM protein [Bryobacteraceae bacterium]
MQPPVSLENTSPCLDDKQFGLGMLALAAFLKSQGIETFGVHVPLALARGKTVEQIVSAIQQRNPGIFAIGLNWLHFSRGAIQLARLLKSAVPDALIVIGGQHATLFAETLVEFAPEAIDAVICGEAELPLYDICRSSPSSAKIEQGIPGVILSREKWSKRRPSVIPDVDSLPLYSYRDLQPSPFDANTAALTTGRGPCPFQCAYCVEPMIGQLQGRDRLVLQSAERIAEQIASLMNEGMRRFTVQDAFFVGGDRLITELASVLARRGLRPAHFNVFAHPGSYTLDGLRALASIADTTTIDYGAETGCGEVSSWARRPTHPDRTVPSVEWAVEAGVIPYTWWLVGLPGEDASAMAETKTLIAATMAAGAAPRWVSPVILFPQTAMWQQAAQFGMKMLFESFDDYSRFSESTLAESRACSNLITHCAADGHPDQTLRRCRELNRFIAANMEIVRRFYRDRPNSPAPDFSWIERSITNSM